MESLKKLPDAEFEVMKAVWTSDLPVTANNVVEKLGESKDWKVQTVISLMNRLVKRGFLTTEKRGKERTYFPLISKEEYLKFETAEFVKQYHNNSVLNLVNTLYDDKALSHEDIEELIRWAKERKG